MMHYFNSVSGMWSDSQLKGRGGERNKCGRNRDRRRGGTQCKVTAVLAKELGGGIPAHLVLFTGFGEMVKASGEERNERRVETTDGKEGPVWLLSASHVSKPVLKNE